MSLQTFDYPFNHNVQFIKKQILSQMETSKFLNTDEPIIFSINDEDDITYYKNNMFGDDLHTEELQRMLHWFITYSPELFLNHIFYDLYINEHVTLHVVTKKNITSDRYIIDNHHIIKFVACDKKNKYYSVETYQNI